MLRTLLAGRPRLQAHFEMREQPTFDLVLARNLETRDSVLLASTA